ncbi:hypothetical protein [Actinoplanes philippinensis]|uniref:hypothetical protein n=1 Tax=Actinoplanes philippinensis TaxID=35752 RepID=UPI0033FBEA1D
MFAALSERGAATPPFWTELLDRLLTELGEDLLGTDVTDRRDRSVRAPSAT